MKNARDKHHNKWGKKTTEYYENNIEFLKEDARSKYRNLSEKEKEKKETDVTWILI